MIILHQLFLSLTAPDIAYVIAVNTPASQVCKHIKSIFSRFYTKRNEIKHSKIQVNKTIENTKWILFIFHNQKPQNKNNLRQPNSEGMTWFQGQFVFNNPEST